MSDMKPDRPKKFPANVATGSWTHEQRGNEYLYQVRLEMVRGRVVPVDFRLTTVGSHAVTHEALNRFPLAATIREHVKRFDYREVLEATIDAADMTATQRRDARALIDRIVEAQESVGRKPRKRNRREPDHDGDWLRTVLVPRFLELQADPTVKNVNATLGEEFFRSPRTIANNLTRARSPELGLLPPASRRQRATPKKKGSGR
jgi:hypothetical protein